MDDADPPQPARSDVRAARKATIAAIAVSVPIAILLWFAAYYLLPPLAGMDDVVARLVFASQYTAIIAELWELGLFLVFWLIQTIQKWEPPTDEELRAAAQGAVTGA